jgi:hypothetical protein
MDLVSNHVGHNYAKVVYAGSPAALTDCGRCGAMYLRALDGIYIGTAPDPQTWYTAGGYRDGANAYTVLIYRKLHDTQGHARATPGNRYLRSAYRGPVVGAEVR